MLANRLAILEHNNNIRGFEVWNSIQTRFRSVQANEQGDVLLDASIWSRMSEAFNKLNSFESEWQLINQILKQYSTKHNFFRCTCS